MSTDIIERVRKAENLPSLPTVAVEILRLSRQDDAGADDLAAVIQNDPALTGKMLKMVNSSMFGIPREISSLKQAVAMLGSRTVKVMALSFSLADAVGGADGEGLDFEAYWRRSLSCAVAARLIGQSAAPRVAEEAFVAALLSDIGIVAAWKCIPELYLAVSAAQTESEMHPTEVEVSLLGVTHARIGKELLTAWGLPENLCNAVGAHHGEGLAALAGASHELAKVVRAAAMVADLFCNEIPFPELEHVKALCLDSTGIDEAALEEILESLDSHVREAASMLSVQVGETIDYNQVRAEAAARLAQLSMQAELERTESLKKEQQSRMEAQRLHEEKKAILEVASTDSLTRVANRAAFDKRLDEELKRAVERGAPLGLIMMDVDHFKDFNDTHGHQAGDEVLRTVGDCLKGVVRDVGFVARYGGEEFAVVLAGMTADAVRDLAESARTAVESTAATYDQNELRVTASFGVACFGSQLSSITTAQAIETADKLLYTAKHNGRNRVESRWLN